MTRRKTPTKAPASPQDAAAKRSEVQTLVLPRIGPSLNEWYSGSHWSKRSRTKSVWRSLVKFCAAAQGVRPAASYPVRLEIVCRFGKGDRSYDCTNLAATAKLIEDGLVNAGILENDSRRYVRPLVLDSIRHDAPSDTLVTITEPRGLVNQPGLIRA